MSGALYNNIGKAPNPSRYSRRSRQCCCIVPLYTYKFNVKVHTPHMISTCVRTCYCAACVSLFNMANSCTEDMSRSLCQYHFLLVVTTLGHCEVGGNTHFGCVCGIPLLPSHTV